MSVYKYKDNFGEDDGKCHSPTLVGKETDGINIPDSRVALCGPATAPAMTRIAPHLLS